VRSGARACAGYRGGFSCSGGLMTVAYFANKTWRNRRSEFIE
jgi:hypothetical protein